MFGQNYVMKQEAEDQDLQKKFLNCNPYTLCICLPYIYIYHFLHHYYYYYQIIEIPVVQQLNKSSCY